MAWSLMGGKAKAKTEAVGGVTSPVAPRSKPNPFFHSEYVMPLWIALAAIGLSLYMRLMWLGQEPSVFKRFAAYIVPLLVFAYAATLAWDIKKGRVKPKVGQHGTP